MSMALKKIEERDVALINAWETNNANIITYINNSIEHFIGMQLAKYDNKGGIGSSAKVIHAMKLCKAVSVRE